jgi:hypothetical protein
MCASDVTQSTQESGQYRGVPAAKTGPSPQYDAAGNSNGGGAPRSDGRPAATLKKVVRNRAGQLEAYVDGRDGPVVDVRVARCFPWSLPGSYVSIRDKEGKELVLLKTLEELDPSSREIVQEELRGKVFNPKIRRIKSHKSEFDVISITAETDRGEVTFQIRSRDDVRLLSDRRALFRDADGDTYELADLHELDPVSRRRLREYF